MLKLAASIGLTITTLIATSVNAQGFKLSSTSVAEGTQLSSSLVLKGFGCQGDNQSPQLSWSGAPVGTKSFAVTVYDPDAPTGSGWWHWTAVNIPAAATSLAVGASGTGAMPAGTFETINDYGMTGFGGACPPKGEVHRYIFTVYALSTERMELPKSPSNALAGFMIRANTIQSARITAIYTR